MEVAPAWSCIKIVLVLLEKFHVYSVDQLKIRFGNASGHALLGAWLGCASAHSLRCS